MGYARLSLSPYWSRNKLNDNYVDRISIANLTDNFWSLLRNQEKKKEEGWDYFT